MPGPRARCCTFDGPFNGWYGGISEVEPVSGGRDRVLGEFIAGIGWLERVT
jgi:hypothetical protein